MTVFPRVMELLQERGGGKIRVTGGGIIPEEDMQALRDLGIERLFGPGSSLEDIVAHVRSLAESR
jgi:methylmalonyl-CoA mutase C-terminal domain/subunit